MQGSLLAADRRTWAILGGGLLGTACLGLLAGHSPQVALAATLAIALAAAMLRQLPLAVAIFTLASFLEVLSLGGAASAVKAAGALLVLAWLATVARQERGGTRGFLREHRLIAACACGLVAWSVLSASWAPDPSNALAGAVRYAMDVALLPIVFTATTHARHARWALAAFVAGVLGSALYGALAQAPIDGSRLTGASGDPNETAALLLAASVLALVLGLGERRRSLRVLALLAAPAGLFGLVATASRGGAIALGITALAAIVLAGRWRRQVTIAASTATVLVIGWFALLAPASSRTHITSTESGRTTLWTVAGRVIEANPVVGLGNDNFAPEAKRYLIQPGATNGAGDILATAPKPVHNAYLELWADLGIVGLALFAALVVGALRCAWRATKLLRSAGRRSDEILARGLAVAIIAMLAADLFLSDLYSKQLFLLIALAPAMLRAARLQLAPAALAHTGFRPVGPSPRWASTAS